MENTDKIFFKDNASCWFLAKGDSWLGPLKASEIYEKLKTAEITWVDFIWKQNQKDWLHVFEVEDFQAFLPVMPSQKLLEAVKEASKPKPKVKPAKTPPPLPVAKEEVKEWYLFDGTSQYGPFSESEVINSIKSERINAKNHAWKDGMNEWQTLDTISEWVNVISSLKAEKKPKTPPKPTPKTENIASHKTVDEADELMEQRIAPRRPLVARIMIADNKSFALGMCRDISIGGMQILTDQIPGPAGTKVKLNVSPPSATKSSTIDAFVAEGVVVRILEDKRGFSFRFENISDKAKDSIENYIRSSD